MDAVYILGDGSLWNNNEIKYSVRSLHKNMRDLHRVIVVGKMPDCLPGVLHIPCSDFSHMRSHNAYFKTLKACRSNLISQEFFLMNDDFFMTSKFVAQRFPYYILKGSQNVKATISSVPVHCPLRIDKQKYLDLQIDIHNRRHFSPRSDYIREYNLPVEEVEDRILKPTGSPYDYDKVVKNWDWFSIGDTTATRPDFQSYIDTLFPDPSPFEKPSS